MGTSKVKWYKDEYYRGNLPTETCEILESLLDLDDANGVVSDLRHVIFDLPLSDVNLIKSYNSNWVNVKDSLDIKRKIGTLEDYQTIGVAYMYWAGNCLLGDSMGMGKTPMTAGLCNLLRTMYEKEGKSFNFLLLTEKSSVLDIQNKMIQFTGDFVEVCLGDSVNTTKFTDKYELELPYSVVGNHSILKSGVFIEWMEFYKSTFGVYPFDLIVIDESSVVGGSSKTGYSSSMRSWMKYAKRFVFLNATPFETKADTMYNQLDLLDSSFLPTKELFNKEFAVMDYRFGYPRLSGKYIKGEVFHERCKLRYFARTRKQKGAIMENCRSGKLVSNLSDIQKYWMNRTSLNQLVCDAPNYFDSDIEFNEVNVPKLRCIQFLLQTECEDARSIIIFAYHKFTLSSLSEYLSKEGYSNAVLNGDVKSTAKRQEIITEFRQGSFQVLLTNIQKGLDFGECDHCIFYSLDPNPGKALQSEGRITRSFDIQGKNVYLLVSAGYELKRLKNVFAPRVKNKSEFTTQDHSLLTDLILGEEFLWDYDV